MSRRFSSYALALALCVPLAACDGCKNEGQSGPGASASASASATAQAALRRGAGIGLNFAYPDPYRVVVSTSNPTANQIAISHDKLPGVLTLRLNAQDPTAPVDLDQLAEATRATMDPAGTIAPTTMKVGSKAFDARTVTSASLGLVPLTDVVAVVPMGGRNYVVLLHAANEDVGQAAKMFAVVLGSVQPD